MSTIAMLEEITRLSAAAQFDDLCRCNRSLSAGDEKDFIKFAKHVAESHSQWLLATQQVAALKKELDKCTKDRDAFETKWKHAITLMESEMQKRQRAEKEKKSLEKQVILIKELLSDSSAVSLDDQTKEKLTFFTANPQQHRQDAAVTKGRFGATEDSWGSISSPDVSFDKTDDDLDNFGVSVQAFTKFLEPGCLTRSKRTYAEGSKTIAKKSRS